MIETHRLCKRILSPRVGIGARRFARAVGRTLSCVYAWGRHPMDQGEPDGTGSTNVLDWFEATVEALGAHPRARTTLLMLERWTRELFDRVLRGDERRACGEDVLVARLADAAKEHGEFMSAALENDDWLAALTEGLEARNAIDQCIDALVQREDDASVVKVGG